MEERLGERGEHVVSDASTAGRLPHDGHPVGVATEVGDVLLHPLQRQVLVQQAHVA